MRELDNVMQRACIYGGDELLEARHLRFEMVATATDAPRPPRLAEPAAADPVETGLGDDLRSRERRLILEALREGRGSRKYAAERLGISPRTLRYKLARMREAGLDVPAVNGTDE